MSDGKSPKGAEAPDHGPSRGDRGRTARHFRLNGLIETITTPQVRPVFIKRLRQVPP